MPVKPFRALHTSDWHIGKKLFGHERHGEFEAFFKWLADIVRENRIDALLVAGDIFDTISPGNRARKIYYDFLHSMLHTCCQNIIITAGNHDSPAFLDAPKDILRALRIHVVGSPAENPEDEVLVLRDEGGEPRLIVCAAPHLRERDARTAEAGESMEDKDAKLRAGIAAHYEKLAREAEKCRQKLGRKLPVVALGHLFAAGAKTAEGDGTRDLYIGSLGEVDAGIFPPLFSYVALGHIHSPQKVAGLDHIRYSGSPLPMSFGEKDRDKTLILLEFKGEKPDISEIAIPLFRPLETIEGDWPRISGRLRELGMAGLGDAGPLLEVIYNGREIMDDFSEKVDALAAEYDLKILNKRNERLLEKTLGGWRPGKALGELSVEDVFKKCLAANEIPESEWDEYMDTFRETVARLREDGSQA